MNSECLGPANNIASNQDRPEMIDLLRARDRVYHRAKLCQGLFVAITVALGVVGVFSSTELKPYFGLAGILALLLDVCFLEKHQKDLCKLGARLGEDFDIQVLKLKRNPFVAEKPVAPEDVHEYASIRLTPERENQLRAWYEPVVARVPLPVGRLICQRLNVSYDAALRTKYGQGLLLVALAFVILILFGGLAMCMAWADVVLAFVAVLPPLAWALREWRKHREFIEQLTTLRSELDRLWARVFAGAPESELEAGSRQLQDAIFRQRASTTLIFDWVYQRLRPKREEQASQVAGRLVGAYQEAHLQDAV